LLGIKIANAHKLPPEKMEDFKKLAVPPMKIMIALPGKGLEASAGGTIKDNTVTWTIPVTDVVGRDATDLTVKYERPKI
jgi:hypothetical protein